MLEWLFDSRRKANDKEGPDALLAKVNRYADGVKTCENAEEFRRATVRSIAEHNEMKTRAYETPDPATFETLMPFARYFANKVNESAASVAADRAVELELWMRCDDHPQDRYRENFSMLLEHRSCHVVVNRKLVVADVEYEFADLKTQWEFFYQLVEWLPEYLSDFGLGVVLENPYGREGGWNAERDSITFSVRWGDDNFIDACRKLSDTAQAQAFMDGVPLEDVVA